MLSEGPDFADLSLRLCPKKAQPLQFLEGRWGRAAAWGGSQEARVLACGVWSLTFFRDLPTQSEWLGSSHRAVWSSVPGPGDEALTWHLPPSSLALSTGCCNLPACPGSCRGSWHLMSHWPRDLARKLLAVLERMSSEKGERSVPAPLKPRGAREQPEAGRSREGQQWPPGAKEENRQPKGLFLLPTLQALLPRDLPEWLTNVLVHREITWFSCTESSVLPNKHPLSSSATSPYHPLHAKQFWEILVSVPCAHFQIGKSCWSTDSKRHWYTWTVN